MNIPVFSFSILKINYLNMHKCLNEYIVYTNILGMGRRGGSIDFRKGGGWGGEAKITSPLPFSPKSSSRISIQFINKYLPINQYACDQTYTSIGVKLISLCYQSPELKTGYRS